MGNVGSGDEEIVDGGDSGPEDTPTAIAGVFVLKNRRPVVGNPDGKKGLDSSGMPRFLTIRKRHQGVLREPTKP